MVEQPDRRRHAWREDLADRRLEGRVSAARFVEGQPAAIAWLIAPVRRRPDADAPLETQALRGEEAEIFSRGEGEGGAWVWAQLKGDGYVGYLPAAALAPLSFTPATHRVSVPATLLFPGPDIKRPPLEALPMGARLLVSGEASDHNATYAAIEPEGFVVVQHLEPVETTAPDPVAIAERFLDAPYLWGGKSVRGIDCSGLVQIACQMAGIAAPRDTDMQEAELGMRVAGVEALRRGDLIFWKGHVGLMLDGTRLLHANAFHMRVAVEPLAEAIERSETRGHAVTSVRRLPSSARSDAGRTSPA